MYIYICIYDIFVYVVMLCIYNIYIIYIYIYIYNDITLEYIKKNSNSVNLVRIPSI